MAKLNIREFTDPRLRTRAAPVPAVDDGIRQLIDDMLETMYDAPGVGLAAPQVGVLTRVIVADAVKDPNAAPQPMVMFNPEVVLSSDETNIYEEGCLSIPDQYAEVTRPAEVRVAWIDRHGNPQEGEFGGLWATVLQHEIDHLNGVLFIDYLSRLKRDMIVKKFTKQKRAEAM